MRVQAMLWSERRLLIFPMFLVRVGGWGNLADHVFNVTTDGDTELAVAIDETATTILVGLAGVAPALFFTRASANLSWPANPTTVVLKEGICCRGSLFCDACFTRGNAVAVNGNTAVVGNRYSRNAFVFVRDKATGLWPSMPTNELNAADQYYEGNTHFGCGVAIHGDTIVVGSLPSFDVSDSKVHIFTRSSSDAAWGTSATVVISATANTLDRQRSGCTNAISGNTIGMSGITSYGQDSVKFFVQDDEHVWPTKATKSYNPIGNKAFAGSVAIDNETMVVGFNLKRKFQIYDRYVSGGRATNSWIPDTSIRLLSHSYHGRIGSTVAVSGDTIAVGAPKTSSTGPESYGRIYIFSRYCGSQKWSETPTATQFSGETPSFGTSMALSGDTLVVGGKGSGSKVWIFRNEGNASCLVTTITTTAAATTRIAVVASTTLSTLGPTTTFVVPPMGRSASSPLWKVFMFFLVIGAIAGPVIYWFCRPYTEQELRSIPSSSLGGSDDVGYDSFLAHAWTSEQQARHSGTREGSAGDLNFGNVGRVPSDPPHWGLSPDAVTRGNSRPEMTQQGSSASARQDDHDLRPSHWGGALCHVSSDEVELSTRPTRPSEPGGPATFADGHMNWG